MTIGCLTNNHSLRGCTRFPKCAGAPEPNLASDHEKHWWLDKKATKLIVPTSGHITKAQGVIFTTTPPPARMVGVTSHGWR